MISKFEFAVDCNGDLNLKVIQRLLIIDLYT